MSVEELKKNIANITRDKVNPQEPPSHIPIATSGQPKEQASHTLQHAPYLQI